MPQSEDRRHPDRCPPPVGRGLDGGRSAPRRWTCCCTRETPRRRGSSTCSLGVLLRPVQRDEAPVPGKVGTRGSRLFQKKRPAPRRTVSNNHALGLRHINGALYGIAGRVVGKPGLVRAPVRRRRMGVDYAVLPASGLQRRSRTTDRETGKAPHCPPRYGPPPHAACGYCHRTASPRNG